ncbi:hypothetical protein C1646_775154 [Rhizophagus diaphanus]|nr:hypothetical protein C1646_775154 [Rhizophagus diaphanus] [Rhizophagus sp. MUCL 43196]
MEFDSNDIQDDDVNKMSEQNPSEKEKETETSSLSFKSGSQKYQGVNKRKNVSFTKQYFEIGYNLKGEQTCICNILDKNGKRCDKIYQNTGSSTGNLVAHLQDVHQIIENENTSKRFDPSFVVPGKQKIKTMIVKSYQYNYENLKNILKETAITVSLTTNLWSNRTKHANAVTELLYEYISSWDLSECVTAMITDNSSNMKMAFPILILKN